MNELRAAAIDAAAAAHDASTRYRGHGDACPGCTLNRKCELSVDLQEAAYAASQAARAALLTYLPAGTLVTYKGAAAHQHGEWWVADTDRSTLHGAYLLTRPHGQVIQRVPVADLAPGDEPIPDTNGILAAVREAVAELCGILAACNLPLPVIVDVDGLGRVIVTYSSAVYVRTMAAALARKQSTTSEANERASYAIAALRSLSSMRTFARTGALTPITVATDAARRTREQMQKPTKRPTQT
ncbi:hypothetical protein [Nonomuraea lactucae]|uniref:hypothetical protein n=1 Tax=Nonomuraea lactucae TaxID=2249762 RepID=UPI000DE20C2F|nr:hypothetical protein [Nonomuraea lactucae]